jgi:hypothetical protein
MSAERANDVARDEWQAGISGACGVCLREFTPASCIRKAILASQLKAALLRELAQVNAAHLLLNAQEPGAICSLGACGWNAW